MKVQKSPQPKSPLNKSVTDNPIKKSKGRKNKKEKMEQKLNTRAQSPANNQSPNKGGRKRKRSRRGANGVPKVENQNTNAGQQKRKHGQNIPPHKKQKVFNEEFYKTRSKPKESEFNAVNIKLTIPQGVKDKKTFVEKILSENKSLSTVSMVLELKIDNNADFYKQVLEAEKNLTAITHDEQPLRMLTSMNSPDRRRIYLPPKTDVNMVVKHFGAVDHDDRNGAIILIFKSVADARNASKKSITLGGHEIWLQPNVGYNVRALLDKKKNELENPEEAKKEKEEKKKADVKEDEDDDGDDMEDMDDDDEGEEEEGAGGGDDDEDDDDEDE